MTSTIRLYGLDFTVEEILRTRRRNGLLKVSISIGEGGKEKECSGACPYCFEDDSADIVKFSMDEIRNIVDQAAELGSQSVCIVGYGETLMPHRLKETFEVVRYIHESDLIPIVFTNGLDMTPETAYTLDSLNASIITKLNSFDPDVQDYLIGKKNSLPRMRRAIDILIKGGFNDSTPTRLGLETVVTSMNNGELVKLAEFCVENNIYFYAEQLKADGKAANRPDLILSPERAREAFDPVLKQYPDIFGTDGVAYPPQGRCCLINYYGGLFITPQRVKLCASISQNLGDARIDTLKEINESEAVRKMRSLKEYIHGKCSTCPELQTEIPRCYGGCRGNAYAITGDFLASDPDCWHE